MNDEHNTRARFETLMLPLMNDAYYLARWLMKNQEDGYNVLHWARDGFEFWAVSDVNAGDLRAFADLEMKQA
jgi:hypothetical protein